MWAIPGLVCRVLLHHTGRHDPVRSQWIGSWAWAVLAALNLAVDILVAPATTCPWVLQEKYMVPCVFLLVVLINGSHGLGFTCKFALIAIALIDCVVGFAQCHDPELGPWFICTMGVIVLGSVTTHTAELYLRRIYAEKVQEQQSRTEEATRGRRLEERNEQLQAEKERLLYDVQRRGRPLDDDDDRSAIRRGLQAGSSQPYPLTVDADPSEPGGALSSVSLPTLPPGPPSSASGGSVAPPLGSAWSSQSDVVPLSWVEADRQWHAADQWQAETVSWARIVVAQNAAGAATLAAPPAAEAICGEELMETILAEMETDGNGTAAASTVHASAHNY